MSKEIKLNNGLNTIVDDCDFDALKQHKWRGQRHKGGTMYVMRQCRDHTKKDKNGYGLRVWHSMARQIMGNPKKKVVDHINGNTLDNRRKNLRSCTIQQNLYNTHARKGLYKGVSRTYISKKKGQRWSATIGLDGKTRYLGVFSSPQDAARAYDRAALRLFGEYACTNFPR